MPSPFAHCSFCGAPWLEAAGWPRTCNTCGNLSYRNPLPVAVLLVPVDDGLLVIRRGIQPRRGQLALPGGFINLGESWQQAAARELLEETQLELEPASISLFDVHSAPDSTLLVFGLAPALSSGRLPRFTPTDETSERLILTAPAPMAFPLHLEVVERFFRERGSSGI